MASSSSSSSNQLQNTYFFYGTHPLKVPNLLVHANSTTSLATNSSTTINSTHLSLATNPTDHYYHGFSSINDLPTTKSLQNLTESRSNDDENNEVIVCVFSFVDKSLTKRYPHPYEHRHGLSGHFHTYSMN